MARTLPRLAPLARPRRWLAAALLVAAAGAEAFDHGTWDGLLRRHVIVAADGHSSRLRYSGMARERQQLGEYLARIAALPVSEYESWPRPEKLAYLINAYNALTVELVLAAYPDVRSIRDLGHFFQSPWRRKFFRLLGRERSLDEIEHDLLRAPGAFDEPRIHFALVCASIGCPMLRNEAYVADRIEAQLGDALRRFLGDRSRNRFDSSSATLHASRIFEWYGSDFGRAPRSRDARSFFAAHAELLADDEGARSLLRAGEFRIRYLDYDWALNDAGP